ncbi:MAG: hypothetical protein HYV32_03735 [Candidatus Kerfeldbacteria bacterium]|nr:hypothetical protein [Candidatus Kerfeldbacteria bacterium]
MNIEELHIQPGQERKGAVHEKRTREESIERIHQAFIEAGKTNLVEWLKTPEMHDVYERIIFLDQYTEFVQDELNGILGGEEVIATLEQEGNRWNKNECEAFEKGSLLSDISKTGPHEATHEEQLLIIEMYSKENIRVTMTIGEFFDEKFPRDAAQRKAQFAHMKDKMHFGKTDVLSLTMEDFYNQHSQWTYNFVKTLSIAPAVQRAASLHHKLKGDFVPELVTAPYDRVAQLVNLMDLYDAFTTRSRMEPAQALDIIKTKFIDLPRNAQYSGELHTLYSAMQTTFLSEQIPMRTAA